MSLCWHPCTCLSICALAFPFVHMPFHFWTCLYLLRPCLRICMHRQSFVGIPLLLCVCTLTLVLAGMRTYTYAGIQAFACIIDCTYTLLHNCIFSTAITGSCAYICTCSSMRSLAFACMLIIYGYLGSHIIDWMFTWFCTLTYGCSHTRIDAPVPACLRMFFVLQCLYMHITVRTRARCMPVASMLFALTGCGMPSHVHMPLCVFPGTLAPACVLVCLCSHLNICSRTLRFVAHMLMCPLNASPCP